MIDWGDVPTWITTLAVGFGAAQLYQDRQATKERTERDARLQVRALTAWAGSCRDDDQRGDEYGIVVRTTPGSPSATSWSPSCGSGSGRSRWSSACCLPGGVLHQVREEQGSGLPHPPGGARSSSASLYADPPVRGHGGPLDGRRGATLADARGRPVRGRDHGRTRECGSAVRAERWRRRWDLNPRYPYGYSTLAGWCTRPNYATSPDVPVHCTGRGGLLTSPRTGARTRTGGASRLSPIRRTRSV